MAGWRKPQTPSEAEALLSEARRRLGRAGMAQTIIAGVAAGLAWVLYGTWMQGEGLDQVAGEAVALALVWIIMGLTLGRRLARRAVERAESKLVRDGHRVR
ncbi:MAG: hypothetical protein R3324_02830 [Halobacteriales archaeon]|nr:hypothetical protein [Halobacteriales archaeon]